MKEQRIHSFIGEDTAVEVFFDYQPREPQTQDHPGCEEEVTLNGVQIGNDNLLDDLNEATKERLRLQCLESMH